MTVGNRHAMGWIPDYPDIRDYTEETEDVKSVLGTTGIAKGKGLPASMDLRDWCSPVEDQGGLGSCTAHAGAGVIEYYERKSFGKGFWGQIFILDFCSIGDLLRQHILATSSHQC